MGQSSGKERGADEENYSENSENCPEDRNSRKENKSKKRLQKSGLRFKIGDRLREKREKAHGEKLSNEKKRGDGIKLTEVEKDSQSETVESAGKDRIPERVNQTVTSSADDTLKDLVIEKGENSRNVVNVCIESGPKLGNEHLDCESGKQGIQNPECTENSVECILVLAELANGITSSISPEEVCEEERNLLDRRVLQLETPFKWLSEIKLNDEVLSCSNEGCESYEISKDTKGRQDYFHIATYHLCQSAAFCKDHPDHQKALRELYQANLAIKRFALQIEKEKEETSDELEDVRRDQDIMEYLRLVLTGSIAYIACQMTRYNEVKILLQDIETNGKFHTSEAIIKGIQGMTLANFKSTLPIAIRIIRETIGLDPNFWRWHMVLSKLLQIIPEPEDFTDKIMRLDEISKGLWKVHQLRKDDPVSAISLGDSYCNSLFLVRNSKNSFDNHEEYADKAVDAYTTALSRAPQCALTHARAARCLWNLRKQHREASKKALVAAEKAMAIILSMDVEEEAEDRDQLRKVAEAAMILGLFWESVGNVDKALALFRMAASNPCVHLQVAYRSELGIIIGSFQNDHKKRSHTKTNVPSLLDKLLEKFQDGNHKQQTLCHKGQYLMDVKKDNMAALDEFVKAIMINPCSSYLKKFYPRFTTAYSRPVRISDLIHELACKELSSIIIKAKKGCPEAIEHSKYLNECIKLAQDSAGSSQSNNPHLSKLDKTAVVLETNSEKQNLYDNLCGNVADNEHKKKLEIPGNHRISTKSDDFIQRDENVSAVAESLTDSKSNNPTDLHHMQTQNTNKIKEIIDSVNSDLTLSKESNQDVSSDGNVTISIDSIHKIINYKGKDEGDNNLVDVLDDSKNVENKINPCAELIDNGEHHCERSDKGVIVVKMIKKKTNEDSQGLSGNKTNDTSENHFGVRETYV